MSAAPLAGRAVLVTGGSSGIGRAIAIAAARAGADVAITYRANSPGAEEVQRAISALGRRTSAIRLDLASNASVGDLGSSARRALGRVDVWINNAGADILTGTAASLSRIEKLDRLIAVDLRGTMVASWQAAEMLAAQDAGGVIINMSWDHVLTGMAGENPELYAAVKGGILAFSKSLARSVAPRVRVNVIAPGFIETGFGEAADERWRRTVVDATPLQRWGTPDDVAGAAVFLASPAAAFLTGQTILVGGGVVM
ncbi:MAG TPA: SDR family oxidoreductase [Vicinamibacterales bacterium]|nr:SDR family oxidoreductase [Vicinamibacterales bacterium]